MRVAPVLCLVCLGQGAFAQPVPGSPGNLVVLGEPQPVFDEAARSPRPCSSGSSPPAAARSAGRRPHPVRVQLRPPASFEGERERTEISRTTISREEAEKVAGAQGDSLKVVEDCPAWRAPARSGEGCW